MKKYWIVSGSFRNAYELYYTENAETESKLPKDAERITYKKAVAKIVVENETRKTNPSFAWYGDTSIYPTCRMDIDFVNSDKWEKVNYCWVRRLK
jgi:hypothetical protein